MKLSTTLILILLFTSNIYSNITGKDLNSMIKKKQEILLKTQKSDTTDYISLYDEIAELTISKNKLLLDMDKVDDIDTDKTCDFILKYGEIEFIKTQYYKTPFHDEVAKTLLNIATLYEQCYPPMAEKYLKSILTIKEHIYLNDSAEVAKAHDALGDYYRIYMANFKRAIKEYVKAKRIRKKLYGIQDPRITENYERLALSLYYHSDKTGKAEKLLLDSIEIREKAFPNINFPLYIAYMDMGIHYSMKNTYSKSIIYLQKALKVFSGKTDSDYLAIVSQLSRDYLSHNDSHNALKYAEEGYRASKVFYKSDKHYRVLENCRHLDEIQKKVRK